MLVNENDAAIEPRLGRFQEILTGGAAVLGALRSHPEPFEMLAGPESETGAWDFAALSEVEGRPNRSRLKFFLVPDGPQQGRPAVFFYKRSQIPFSRDRFSYGVCMIPTVGPAAPELQEWLDYAAGGFDPEKPPRGLRKAFTFNVPE